VGGGGGGIRDPGREARGRGGHTGEKEPNFPSTFPPLMHTWESCAAHPHPSGALTPTYNSHTTRIHT
jgi:hypothetical protein